MIVAGRSCSSVASCAANSSPVARSRSQEDAELEDADHQPCRVDARDLAKERSFELLLERRRSVPVVSKSLDFPE
jgi:hypothetical protein